MINVGGKVLRRIRISSDWIQFVKAHAKRNKTKLSDIVADAIRWWSAERKSRKSKYLAPHGKTESWSLWLKTELASTVAEISAEDVTTDSSVIYTSLVLYCELVLKGKPTAQVLGVPEYSAATSPDAHQTKQLVKAQ